MRAVVSSLLVVFMILLSSAAYAKTTLYGSRYCSDPHFFCYKVKRGDSWDKLFKDAPNDRDLAMRINRMNTHLYPGLVIAIPRRSGMNPLDFAPFPKQISAPGERIILVSLDDMAWGAYESNGELERWGPTSSARGYCPDIGHGCHTATGRFAIYSKEGRGCYSRKFPVGRGGAPMPYCMFFYGGFALHGSYEVPGYNASHGCLRIFVDDAEWLNEEFTDISTPVIVRQGSFTSSTNLSEKANRNSDPNDDDDYGY